MRKLAVTFVLLVVLAGVLLVLDVAAKGYVEARVEDEFRNGGRIDAEEVAFAIDSFPFLGRFGVSGEVSARLHLEGIEEQGVVIDEFDLDVDGLVFDRVSAFNGDVRVTGLDQATTTITLSEATITELAGVPVDITADGTVTAGGVAVQTVMDGDGLVLTAAGAATPVPFPMARFLACAPEVAVWSAQEEVTLTCVTEQLPPVINRVLGEAGARLRG